MKDEWITEVLYHKISNGMKRSQTDERYTEAVICVVYTQGIPCDPV